MTKSELELLERAFNREIDAAMTNGIHLVQSKSKAAKSLVDNGLLEKVEIKLGGQFPVTVSGLQLTHAGRIAYCETCYP